MSQCPHCWEGDAGKWPGDGERQESKGGSKIFLTIVFLSRLSFRLTLFWCGRCDGPLLWGILVLVVSRLGRVGFWQRFECLPSNLNGVEWMTFRAEQMTAHRNTVQPLLGSLEVVRVEIVT